MDEQGTGQDWTADLDAIQPDDETGGVALEPQQGESPAAVAPAPERYHIQHGRFDEYLYESAKTEIPALGASVAQGLARWEQTEELAQDAYNALYKPAPQAQDVDGDYQKNARALDEAMTTAEFKALREMTQLDEFGSAVAAATLTRQLVETLAKQEDEEPPTPPVPPSEGEGDEQEGEDQAQQPQGGDEEGGQQGQGQGQGQGQPTPAQQQYQQDMAAYQQAAAEHEAKQRTALRVATRKAASEAQAQVADAQAAAAAFSGDADEIGQGWGQGGGSATQAGDIRQRAKLAQLVAQNPRLQAIARAAGRLRFLAAAAQRSRAEHVPDELHGIERGADLARVLPSETMYLADPDLEDLFYAKYLERGLLQYELHGSEPQGKGPIVFCVDESGSMDGEPAAWAAAVALCLLSIAAKQRRDFRWIHFGSAGQIEIEDYAKGKGTPERVMASALHFFCGGTDFDTPLARALESIEDSQYKKADVVFVTDGICQVGPEMLQRWHAAKKAKEFYCYGMLIGHAYGAQAMKPFCDAVTNVLQPGGRGDQEALAPAFSI